MMMKLGEKQKLKVIKKVNFGVYLAEEADAEEKVLLPAKQVPEGTETGGDAQHLRDHGCVEEQR